ncbi:MAG TPA: LuxR C-terminal-related transcriptional regulator, partial [Candidatus Lustribacter sp.]|nr:LuxR C-terminal-related transcriptional regulator [Candidatus Lustribacter sp.]
MLSSTAAIDLWGDCGDLPAALRVHDDAVEVLTRIWHPLFQAQLRLSALLLGQLASHVQRVPTADRAGLLDRGRITAETAVRVWDQSQQWPGNDGPESAAWQSRAAAEALRLRWLGGAEIEPGALAYAWRESVAAFETYGHIFEAARSRARLGAVLLAAGEPAAGEALRAALETARQLGAKPLRAEIRAVGGADQPPVARPADRYGEALTGREKEILGLLALGRSNRQIGTQLFISAKTASVHGSNIL